MRESVSQSCKVVAADVSRRIISAGTGKFAPTDVGGYDFSSTL